MPLPALLSLLLGSASALLAACNSTRVVNDAAFDCDAVYGDVLVDAACSNVSRIAARLQLVSGTLLLNDTGATQWPALTLARHIVIEQRNDAVGAAARTTFHFDALDACESLSVTSWTANVEVRRRPTSYPPLHHRPPPPPPPLLLILFVFVQ